MDLNAQVPNSDAPESGRFPVTHWSIVLAAGRSESAHAHSALARLCDMYWFPLYAYVRRSGYNPEDAEDLTQDFFRALIEKRAIDSANSAKGRFRSFLLTMLNRHMVNEWHRANRQKRGGGQAFVPFDDTAETRYLADRMNGDTPEKVFERRWAIQVLDRAIGRLENELKAAGKADLFQELRIFLTGEKSERPYAEIAERLGMSQGTVKVTVHRLRQRYRELLRMEIAHTVSDADEIDAEMRHLVEALS